MPNILSRRPDWRAINCHPVRSLNDDPVQNGLSLRPSDIERLASQGIAVSTPAADQFLYDTNQNAVSLDPEYTREADRNSMWEMSQRARTRISKARIKDKQTYR